MPPSSSSNSFIGDFLGRARKSFDGPVFERIKQVLCNIVNGAKNANPLSAIMAFYQQVFRAHSRNASKDSTSSSSSGSDGGIPVTDATLASSSTDVKSAITTRDIETQTDTEREHLSVSAPAAASGDIKTITTTTCGTQTDSEPSDADTTDSDFESNTSSVTGPTSPGTAPSVTSEYATGYCASAPAFVLPPRSEPAGPVPEEKPAAAAPVARAAEESTAPSVLGYHPSMPTFVCVPAHLKAPEAPVVEEAPVAPVALNPNAATFIQVSRGSASPRLNAAATEFKPSSASAISPITPAGPTSPPSDSERPMEWRPGMPPHLRPSFIAKQRQAEAKTAATAAGSSSGSPTRSARTASPPLKEKKALKKKVVRNDQWTAVCKNPAALAEAAVRPQAPPGMTPQKSTPAMWRQWAAPEGRVREREEIKAHNAEVKAAVVAREANGTLPTMVLSETTFSNK